MGREEDIRQRDTGLACYRLAVLGLSVEDTASLYSLQCRVGCEWQAQQGVSM